MSEENESQTFNQLAQLFAREAQTLFRYQWFASTAEFEGCKDAALLLRRLIENQAILVHGHFDLLRTFSDPVSGRPLGGTLHNLTAALAAEEHEAESLYASVASLADAEGLTSVASWLRTLAHAKRASAERLRAVRDEMGAETSESMPADEERAH